MTIAALKLFSLISKKSLIEGGYISSYFAARTKVVTPRI